MWVGNALYDTTHDRYITIISHSHIHISSHSSAESEIDTTTIHAAFLPEYAYTKWIGWIGWTGTYHAFWDEGRPGQSSFLALYLPTYHTARHRHTAWFGYPAHLWRCHMNENLC
jgi:hypothetical protein